jgi:hypothetical protein
MAIIPSQVFLLGFDALSQLNKKVKKIAVRPSQKLWQGLDTKSSNKESLIKSRMTQPNILAGFRYQIQL